MTLDMIEAAGASLGDGPAEGPGSILGPVGDRNTLIQLCGEVLLLAAPMRPPWIVRFSAAVGLELLDLLLNPGHVLRMTEELTLRNTLALGRRVRLDISLDGLSRQQEDGATQLSALVSGRVGLESASDPGASRLWVPLDTVPRPITEAVMVIGTDGCALPRPPQLAVRRAVATALNHVLLESLRDHPDFDEPETSVNRLMRSDNAARWLLQTALLSVCDHSPASARGIERTRAVAARCPDMLAASVPGERLYVLLGGLAQTVPPDRDLAARRRALEVLRDAFLTDAPFLDLLRLVSENYFVVAGLDRSVRDHIVEFDLPAAGAIESSPITSLARRLRGGFDPRDHNYTAHIDVPLPDNIRQYTLLVRTSNATAEEHKEVSLIGMLGFDSHPGRSALDALATCASEMEANLAPVDDLVERESQALKLAYLASQAAVALDRLDETVAEQGRAIDALEERHGRASRETVKEWVHTLRDATMLALARIDAARLGLQGLISSLLQEPLPETDVREATRALAEVIEALEHPLLAGRLISSELTGREVARVRLSGASLASRSESRARSLSLWATVSDESRSYYYGAIGPPLCLALLIYLAGALTFDSPTWPFHFDHLEAATIRTRQADAIVGVLLLIPGFALTQFTVPDRWSVHGRLHRLARMFVLFAVLTLATTSVVVATQIGGADGAPAHPGFVHVTFQVALAMFGGWTLWGFLASGLRRRYSWRPKGIRSLLGVEPSQGRQWSARAAVGRRLRAWRERLRYDNKSPDAAFDLAGPGRRPEAGSVVT